MSGPRLIHMTPDSSTRSPLDRAIDAGDRATAAREAEKVVADLTDGRKLRPLDMLKLAQARRTIVWAGSAR